MSISIYADGADIATIRRLAQDPLVQGFTTNPTLMRKAGVTDYMAFAREAIDAADGRPISFEVLSDDLDRIEHEAKVLSSLSPIVFVKIPVMLTNGTSTLPLVNSLSKSDVHINVTAITTMIQVNETADALNTGTPSFISVFAGRIADCGINPLPFITRAIELCDRNSQMRVIWASPREVYNVIEAEESGCHVITVTPEIFAKLRMRGYDLHAMSLDTVKMFSNDAIASGLVIE